MNSIFSLWLAMLSAPAIILGALEKKLKYYSFLVTIFFVGMTLKNSPEALGWLIAFSLYNYALIAVYIKIRERVGRNKAVYRLFLFASLLHLSKFFYSCLLILTSARLPYF